MLQVARRISRRTSLLSFPLWTLALYLIVGCTATRHCYELSKAVLAGDTVLVELKSYTLEVPMYAHSSRETDVRYFLARVPITDHATLKVDPEAIPSSRIGLQSSYSPDRTLLIRGPDYSKRHTVEAEAYLVQNEREKGWNNMRSWRWRWNEFEAPPFVVSGDGRYLILASEGVSVDTETEQLLDISTIKGALKTSYEIEPDPHRLMQVTNRLGYIVVMPRPHTSTGTTSIDVRGESYTRATTAIAISCKDNRITAIPLKKQSKYGQLWYQAAAEDVQHQLILLYRSVNFHDSTIRYLICDSSHNVLDEINLPRFIKPSGATVGDFSAWDSEHSRLLVYEHVDLTMQKDPITMRIWDHGHGTVQLISFQVSRKLR